MKGSFKARFQKSRSTTFGKRKVFNTRFDVLSQDVESSKTPSSSTRLSGFCESPSLVNIGKKVEEDDAQALRQLELCLRVHAKIASGVYPSPPPGTLFGPVRSVTSGYVVRADGRPDVSRGGVSSRVSAMVDGFDASNVAGSCARVSGPDVAGNTLAFNKYDLALGELGVSPGAVDSAHATADESKGIVELHEVNESDFSKAEAAVAAATAGESEGNTGLPEVIESDFPSLPNSSHSPNSRLGSLSSACARRVARCVAAAPARVCLGSSSSVSAAVAHAHASILHGACINSCSDTVRLQGPTGTRRVKGVVSGPAEDLRPVSEVETGVNVRPAGGVRGQVAGSLPGKQPGTGTRNVRGGAVTPSFPPPGGS